MSETKKTRAKSKKEVPSTRQIPLLPLKDIVVFPHMIVPVFINEELCISAVEKAVANDRKIFLSAFKVPGADSNGLESSTPPPFDVYDTGTVCTIMRTRKLSDNRLKVLVQGMHKAKVIKLTSDDPTPIVEVIDIKEMNTSDTQPKQQQEALIRSVKENLEKVVSLGKALSPDTLMILEDVNEPSRLSDLIAANLGLKVDESQSILSIMDPIERLTKVNNYLSREIEVYQMQVQIQSQAKSEISRMQREHYLREQIRAIKSELGDNDKEEIDSYWDQLDQKPINSETRIELSRQIKRLERMHQDSSEATLTRTHIETVLAMPWGESTVDNLDIKKVSNILENDHYGLTKVKD